MIKAIFFIMAICIALPFKCFGGAAVVDGSKSLEVNYASNPDTTQQIKPLTEQEVLAKYGLDGENVKIFQKLAKIIDITRAGYAGILDDSKITEYSAKGLLMGLDANSGYLNKEELVNIKSNLAGKFAGIGIEIIKDRELVKVISPIDDSPGFRAGIKSGDYIVKIDKMSVASKNINEIVKLLRGEAGSAVNLQIAREGQNEFLNIKVVRDIIETKPVKFKFFDYGNVLYIRISSFIDTTFEQTHEIIKNHLSKTKGIIIDLRNNPGGELEQAILLANMFLDKGETIVKVRGRSKEYFNIQESAFERYNIPQLSLPIIKELADGYSYSASGKGELNLTMPLIVMVNGGSASASEIFTAAIKDNSRGIILGTKTFGKGSVQSIVPIEDGELGAVRLTTAKYYTPKGSVVHEIGIYPDVLVEQKDDTLGQLNQEAVKQKPQYLAIKTITETEVKDETKNETKNEKAAKTNLQEQNKDTEASKEDYDNQDLLEKQDSAAELSNAIKHDYQLDIAFATLKASMLLNGSQKIKTQNLDDTQTDDTSRGPEANVKPKQQNQSVLNDVARQKDANVKPLEDKKKESAQPLKKPDVKLKNDNQKSKKQIAN
jgi:carboxyl-terminal processing protease